MTFETVKVVKPIQDLLAERVYILHWDRSEEVVNKASVYSEFYRRVVRQLKDWGLKDGDIVERKVKVYRFKEVMSELISIMQLERGRGNDVYVNISAGSTEFAAGATVAAMMVDGVKPFTVHTQKYTISDEEKLRESFSCEGELIGQTREVYGPMELPTFHLNLPPRDLVIALRIFRERKEQKKSTNYPTMIKALKEMEAWTYNEERIEMVKDKDSRRGEKTLQCEKMYYSRHYIDGWIKNGWVDGKDGRGRGMQITEAGRNVTDIFYHQ